MRNYNIAMMCGRSACEQVMQAIKEWPEWLKPEVRTFHENDYIYLAWDYVKWHPEYSQYNFMELFHELDNETDNSYAYKLICIAEDNTEETYQNDIGERFFNEFCTETKIFIPYK